MTTSGRNVRSLRTALRRAAPQLARDLPWIAHPDPWAVYVSEVMLQQTSVARVRERWMSFLTKFPTPRALAAAPLDDVLVEWQGMGYPRRAKWLRDAASLMVSTHHGQVPRSPADLLALPGIGRYSAHAIACFAFGESLPVVDTNVGRVLARALMNRPLTNDEAWRAAAELLPRDEVPAFNQALLDLGAQFCRKVPQCDTCPVRQACRWRHDGGEDPAPSSAGVSRPQPKFAGSHRDARGRVMRALSASGQLSRQELLVASGLDDSRLDRAVVSLLDDHLIAARHERYSLARD